MRISKTDDATRRTIGPTIRSSALAGAFALAAVVGAAPALAQSEEQTASEQQADPAAIPDCDDLEFPGGTVEEYLDAVVDMCRGRTVQVVTLGDFGVIEVPPIELRGVEQSVAFDILERLRNPYTGEQMLDTDYLSSSSTDIVLAVTPRAPHVPQPLGVDEGFLEDDRILSDTISLAELLATRAFTREEVFAAIETALQFEDRADRFDFSFHEPTAILYVRWRPERGSSHGLDGVIDALYESAEPIAELKSSIRQVERRLVRIEAEINANGGPDDPRVRTNLIPSLIEAESELDFLYESLERIAPPADWSDDEHDSEDEEEPADE